MSEKLDLTIPTDFAKSVESLDKWENNRYTAKEFWKIMKDVEGNYKKALKIIWLNSQEASILASKINLQVNSLSQDFQYDLLHLKEWENTTPKMTEISRNLRNIALASFNTDFLDKIVDTWFFDVKEFKPKEHEKIIQAIINSSPNEIKSWIKIQQEKEWGKVAEWPIRSMHYKNFDKVDELERIEKGEKIDNKATKKQDAGWNDDDIKYLTDM